MKIFFRALACFFSLFFLVLQPTVGHAQAIPQIKTGTPYDKVRFSLINEGWRPVKQSQESFDFMAQELKQRGWTEIRQCAGTGRSPCIFIWKNRQGRELEVLTTGEEPKFNAFR